MDWDDVRIFLAVVRCGSTQAAARVLNVNQTTVARRVAELEATLGGALFERSREGYRLLSAAEPLADVATRLEAEALSFESLGRALQRGLDTIKVTTNEPLANVVLAPAIVRFAERRPHVRVELVISPRQLDLARGEADLALRAAPTLPDDPGLMARKVGDARWAAYCSRSYADRFGAPADVRDLEQRTLLVIGDPSGSRLAELASGARVERRDTVNDLIVAVRAGLGVASLPCVLGDGQGDFHRCFLQEEPVTPVWLVWRERLGADPAFRELLDAVAEATLAARSALTGA